MAEVIEGRNAVIEALRSGVRIERLLIAAGGGESGPLGEIRRLAADAGIPVADVPRGKLDSLSVRGAHQGVVALAAPFGYTDLEDVLRTAGPLPRALVVVLDHVTDPGNLGAVIRTVEVAGGSAVVMPRERAASVGPVVHKTSAGATAHLPIVQVTNVARTLETLKAGGFWVAGADERGSDDLWSAPLDGRIALVMGAEGGGLSRLARERCDFLVRIPVAGRVSSLNVAQATSVLAFEWVRRGR